MLRRPIQGTVTRILRNFGMITFNSLIVESESGRPRYTHLFACISEEDDGYQIQASPV